MIIPGKPISKARPRFFRRGAFVGTYSTQKTEEGLFMLQVQSRLPPGHKPPSGPVKVELVFGMPIPKSMPKSKVKGIPYWHDKKPDLDNLVKFVLDAIRNLVIADDATVSALIAVKLYAIAPFTEITVEELT